VLFVKFLVSFCAIFKPPLGGDFLEASGRNFWRIKFFVHLLPRESGRKIFSLRLMPFLSWPGGKWRLGAWAAFWRTGFFFLPAPCRVDGGHWAVYVGAVLVNKNAGTTL